MTNQKTNLSAKEREHKLPQGKNVKDMDKRSALAQGMLWHEILSEPLCKRRRNK